MRHERTTAEVEEMETAQDLARDDEARASRPAVLSPRELQVAQLRIEGRAAKEIAYLTQRTQKTIEHCLTRIHKKLGIHKKAELPAALDAYLKERPDAYRPDAYLKERPAQ